MALLDVGNLASATIYLPLPSFGVTNMHVDICSDLLDASWAAEKLAAGSQDAKVINDYAVKHKTRLKLDLKGPGFDARTLEECVLIFQGGDEDDDRYQAIRDAAADYEDGLDTYAPLLPAIIDDYYANLINGAYDHYRSEAPEFYEEEMAKFPERRLGFHKSALSHRLGAASYVSMDGWVVPVSVPVDLFFKATEQKYRIDDFFSGDIFTIGGKSFARSDELVAYFPMSHYFKSRVCASLALRDDEDTWPWNLFDWRDSSFTHSPLDEAIAPPGSKAMQRKREHCLIHSSGTLVILDDGQFRHFLYDTEPLNQVAIKAVHENLSGLSLSLATMIGLSATPSCNWSILSDEDFEQLCYDVIFAHPKFDSDSIRKLGKSRSRDGGRDLEVHEIPLNRSAGPKKWIFQCKLVTDGSSLTGRKLQDVGDMLDSYSAEGFGVMTSTLIDATLYDKLDNVCGKRSVTQLHFSRLELERALVRLPAIRKCYFEKN